MRRQALLLASALFAPFAVRAALLRAEQVGAVDLGGWLSDLAVSLVFAALLALAGARSRWPAALLVAAWGALHYGHYEHVRELDSGLQLAHAGYLADPTFLRGSALAPARPALLALLALGPALLAASALPVRGTRRAASAWALAGLAGLLGTAVLPADPETPRWRRLHFLPDNALHARRGVPPPRPDGEPLDVFRADLTGAPRVRLPAPGTNVLLVVMEGVPGAYVELVARAHGVEPRFTLPHLSELARRNVVATSFVTHQRQTNRGLWALLCGDYPKLALSLAKTTEYLQGGTRRCLPRVLGAASYRSAFLQAAPLSFMFKDAFMRRIGFDRILGDRDFSDPTWRTNWGVDDGSLFRRAAALVDELEAGEGPWFLTLLTVGTHHPFVLPPDADTAGGDEGLRAAFELLDASVGAFVAELERKGVLDRTLTLLTVDESRGLRRSGGSVARLVSQSWGTLIALLPTRDRLVVDAPTAQSDLALSIVDYLGIDAARTPFIGRSFLRSYDSPRRIFFSNAHKRRTGAVVGRDRIYVCDELATRCRRYRAAGPGLFADDPVAEPLEPNELADGHAVVARTLRSNLDARRPLIFDLAQDSHVPLWGVHNQKIVDGQNLFVPAGSRIEVEIDLRVVGARGTVRLEHLLEDKEKRVDLQPTLPALAVGDRLQLRYALETAQPLLKLKCRLRVAESEGEGLALELRTARIGITPLAGGAHRDGLLAEPEIRVERAGAERAGGA